MLLLLLLIVVGARAQDSEEVAEAPAVEEILADEFVGILAGGNTGGLLSGGETPDAPEEPTIPPVVNATEADDGSRRRLMASKKKMNEAVRARRALQAAEAARLASPGAAGGSPITKSTPLRHSASGAGRTLLQKPKTAESAAISISNVLSKLKYEEQQGYKPRNSGVHLVI